MIDFLGALFSMGDGTSILWRREDRLGCEAARIFQRESRWHLDGCAVFLEERHPCRLEYRVVCDARWHTASATVSGWVGDRPIDVEISADSDRRWRMNGAGRPDLDGCIDLDLNFSPSTNLLPIRRLGLAVGREDRVRAAWLRFPTFELEPLEQLYRRTEDSVYRYESGSGRFSTDLEVNRAGFVTRYPGFCVAEAEE